MSYPDQKRLACGSKEFDPPFPFPPGESRGGDGSPHAGTRLAPANCAVTIRAPAPPARGISKRSAEIPLARSPCGAREDPFISRSTCRNAGRHGKTSSGPGYGSVGRF